MSRTRKLLAIFPAALLPLPAQASFLPPALMDKAADILALFVLVFVPLLAVALFWLVHVLPEKIAEKRQHPQKDAIHTLCLLSLAFGGLLWPLAWLWAYARPVGYKLAYGTDKHDDYFLERAGKAGAATLGEEDLRHLAAELDAMAARGALPPRLQHLREELEALRTSRDVPAPQAGSR